MLRLSRLNFGCAAAAAGLVLGAPVHAQDSTRLLERIAAADRSVDDALKRCAPVSATAYDDLVDEAQRQLDAAKAAASAGAPTTVTPEDAAFDLMKAREVQAKARAAAANCAEPASANSSALPAKAGAAGQPPGVASEGGQGAVGLHPPGVNFEAAKARYLAAKGRCDVAAMRAAFGEMQAAIAYQRMLVEAGQAAGKFNEKADMTKAWAAGLKYAEGELRAVEAIPIGHCKQPADPGPGWDFGPAGSLADDADKPKDGESHGLPTYQSPEFKKWANDQIRQILRDCTKPQDCPSPIIPQNLLQPQGSSNLGAFERDVLSAHNAARAAVGVPPLRWNPVIAAQEQRWAESLEQRGVVDHRPRAERGNVRENLARVPANYTIEQTLARWLGEVSQFVPGVFPNVCKAGGGCGGVLHYSQIIWFDTTDIGCGIARGPEFYTLACGYGPGGNKDGQQVGTQEAAAEGYRRWNETSASDGATTISEQARAETDEVKVRTAPLFDLGIYSGGAYRSGWFDIPSSNPGESLALIGYGDPLFLGYDIATNRPKIDWTAVEDILFRNTWVEPAKLSVLEDGSFDDGETYFIFNPGRSMTLSGDAPPEVDTKVQPPELKQPTKEIFVPDKSKPLDVM